MQPDRPLHRLPITANQSPVATTHLEWRLSLAAKRLAWVCDWLCKLGVTQRASHDQINDDQTPQSYDWAALH
ncbi:Uncharacterised protein [Vibrio cholerae]|nr:Uncharacterised protein [Vibrio cholerae]